MGLHRLGPPGIEVLPLDGFGGGGAVDVGGGGGRSPCARGMPLDDSRDLLLTLFQGRVPLVAGDKDLDRGANRRGAGSVRQRDPRGPQSRRASARAVLRVTEALFNTPHLFPLDRLRSAPSGTERSARPPSVQGVHSRTHFGNQSHVLAADDGVRLNDVQHSRRVGAATATAFVLEAPIDCVNGACDWPPQLMTQPRDLQVQRRPWPDDEAQASGAAGTGRRATITRASWSARATSMECSRQRSSGRHMRAVTRDVAVRLFERGGASRSCRARQRQAGFARVRRMRRANAGGTSACYV